MISRCISWIPNTLSARPKEATRGTPTPASAAPLPPSTRPLRPLRAAGSVCVLGAATAGGAAGSASGLCLLVFLFLVGGSSPQPERNSRKGRRALYV